jgi:hypothetical protein
VRIYLDCAIYFIGAKSGFRFGDERLVFGFCRVGEQIVLLDFLFRGRIQIFSFERERILRFVIDVQIHQLFSPIAPLEEIFVKRQARKLAL